MEQNSSIATPYTVRQFYNMVILLNSLFVKTHSILKT